MDIGSFMGKLYCKIREYGITTCAILVFGTSNAIVYSKSKLYPPPSATKLLPEWASIIYGLYRRIGRLGKRCASTPSSTNYFHARPTPFEHRQPPSHEPVHNIRMNENHARLSPALVETCAGLSAGAISTLVVHPLDIIKTRLQSTPLRPLHLYVLISCLPFPKNLLQPPVNSSPSPPHPHLPHAHHLPHPRPLPPHAPPTPHLPLPRPDAQPPRKQRLLGPLLLLQIHRRNAPLTTPRPPCQRPHTSGLLPRVPRRRPPHNPRHKPDMGPQNAHALHRPRCGRRISEYVGWCAFDRAD